VSELRTINEDCLRAGAVEFLTKPFRSDVMMSAIHVAIERSRAVQGCEAGMGVVQLHQRMIAGAVELYVWFCSGTTEANRMSESARMMAEREETLATPVRVFGGLERIASVTSYRFGQTIYFQDQRADCWYCILRGAARECAVNEDGRRQIIDFLLPGDVFGFSNGEARDLAVEVIAGPALVACYPRHRAEALAESDAAVGRGIRRLAFESIERLKRRALLLGCNSAMQKVSAFLLEMGTRSGSISQEPIALPMTRYDIADYLALRVETVSRTLSALRQRGAIALVGARSVRVIDRRVLVALATKVTRLSPTKTLRCA
jgi:CRP/FNR family transcriptional regulator, nitrogen fixation regulation protein